jgi:hypothetical protein
VFRIQFDADLVVSIRRGPRTDQFGSSSLINLEGAGAPIPWQQFVEPLNGMLGDVGQQVGEPGLRIARLKIGDRTGD